MSSPIGLVWFDRRSVANRVCKYRADDSGGIGEVGQHDLGSRIA